MREKLGVVLMEDDDGKVSVQLFENPAAAREGVEQLNGKPGEPKRRATFVGLSFGESVSVEVLSKEIPTDRSETPDYHVVGEGPKTLEEKS